MSAFIANAAVCLLVAMSVGYAIWRLGPTRMRLWAGAHLRRAFPKLLRNVPLSAGGCGDSCGGCASDQETGATSAEVKLSTRIPTRVRPTG